MFRGRNYKKNARRAARNHRPRLIEECLHINNGYLLCCWCDKEMIIPLTEVDGITYRQGQAFVVKSYSIHDTATIEHLVGMDVDNPNGEGCLDLACHRCNTTRNTGDSVVIKPFGPEEPVGKSVFGELVNAIRA